MKKLILAVILMAGMTAFAQDKNDRTAKDDKLRTERLSPEQRNSLRVKELALKLDLSTQQQQEFAKIFAGNTAKREEMKKQFQANRGEMKKLTADERFARKNKMLDEKIAMKARVKSILNADQYKKWEAMQHHKREKVAKMGKKRHHSQKNR